MVRATVSRSAFLWRLINDKPNSEDRFHHNDGDSKKFECLMNYLVKNRVPDILPCSVRDLYNETLFYDKQDKSSKSPSKTSLSSSSSNDSCSESAKHFMKQLTVEDVKTWLQQTMFHHLAEI
ncbi:unnamed protein product [Rotaria sp. Silwood1]|nr:unnamed protein product [Rotaria sp. Silwood1]CAF1614992.1 unnamed protein product [Rotaria sp. Silwood1]